VVADSVNPGRRDPGGEAREQLVGGEHEEERTAARALHPVDEVAVVGGLERGQGVGLRLRLVIEAG
jgi:hypothetical protein